MSEEVRFYRGNSWDRDAQNEAALKDSGEIVFVNDAIGMTASEEGYQEAREFGSIYQDDKIVGTTKADELRLTQDLTVMGTNVGNIPNGKTLSKGTSIEDVLKLMLQKEVGIKTNQPSVSINVGTNVAEVEVGSVVAVKLTSTFTDGSFGSLDTSLWNPLKVNAGCTLESETWTLNGVSIDKSMTEFTAGKGDNKFIVTVDHSESQVKQVENNLGEMVDVNISKGKKSDSKTIKGYYRWNAFSSGGIDIESTSDSWLFTKNVSVENIEVPDGEYAVVLVPEGFELSNAEQMGLNFIPSFTTQEVVLKIGGTSTHNYKMYYWQNISGYDAIINNITIK